MFTYASLCSNEFKCIEKGGIKSCSISLSHAELARPKGKANQPCHGTVESDRCIGEEEEGEAKKTLFLAKKKPLISQLIIPDRAAKTVL